MTSTHIPAIAGQMCPRCRKARLGHMFGQLVGCWNPRCGYTAKRASIPSEWNEARRLGGQPDMSTESTRPITDGALRAWRARHSITQASAAGLMDVTPVTWYRWETGLQEPKGPSRILLNLLIADRYPVATRS